MPQSVKVSGKTIEQALQKALKDLRARQDEVDIEILEGKSRGFFGGLFGAKGVSIRVTLREEKRAENHVDELKGIIGRVLGFMGIDHDVTVESMPDTTFLNINSSGLDGLLIGRRGETLGSLQHVVNRVFTSRTGEHSKITIDVGGYVRRKQRLLIERARKVAGRVRETGREFDFEPLKAAERRIIHLAVSDVDEVSTYTIGDGLLRKVVVTSNKDDEFSSRK